MTALEHINHALDAWIDVRVAAHRARGGPDADIRAIDVPTYLSLLRTVRLVEHVLEDWRRDLGAPDGRAFELVTTDQQLTLQVAA